MFRSGVGNYDIYVSDDGGPWQPWQTANPATSATNSGQPGHYYYFYSVAHDNSGNVQPTPSAYEAMTFVSTNQVPVLPPIADRTNIVGSPIVLTNLASGLNGSQGWTFNLQNAPAGASINPITGTFTWTPTCDEGSTTNLITIWATDNGLPPLSNSVTFAVVVGACMPPTTNIHNFAGLVYDSSLGVFTNSDGFSPRAGLTLYGGALYGTAAEGGSADNGAVFRVNPDGTGFVNLHSFAAGSGSFPNIINTEGAWPVAGLILSGNTLYGTTETGGNAGNGTVFKVNTDGSSFTSLHRFSALYGPYSTNSDGASPQAGLILAGNTLYGTAEYGGSAGAGTVFALNTNGTGFTNLHNFTGGSDGANPLAGLILSGNTLYGTAYAGGSSGFGTVFAINTNGTRLTTLYSFTDGSDGAGPQAG